MSRRRARRDAPIAGRTVAPLVHSRRDVRRWIYGGLDAAFALAYLVVAVGVARSRFVDPTRAVARAAFVLPTLIVYANAAALSGLDPAWLDAPRMSFALPLAADAVFYFALALAADAAWALAARKSCADRFAARKTVATHRARST